MTMGQKVLIVMGLFALLCVVSAAGVAAWYILKPDPNPPVVTIETPSHNEKVEAGAMVSVRSTARGEGSKVARMELWVNGELQAVAASPSAEGSSPFPFMKQWHARTGGSHTLIVRAFNVAGESGQATVVVTVEEVSDRDGDGIRDEEDQCPDEAGPSSTNGCPDRDGDGIRDADDACPDEYGFPENDGCPNEPTAEDRDGDGIVDDDDACPDEPGPVNTDGCPDADGDGVPDAEDDCPTEQGFPEANGCIPDRDGDGVPDAVDQCPDTPGSPDAGGCPDRDDDTVADDMDMCPDDPGPVDNDGCPFPDAGDPPDPDDDSGAPAGPGDGVGPGDMGDGGVTATETVWVTLQGKHAEVRDDYEGVYGALAVDGLPVSRVPEDPLAYIDPMGAKLWDLEAVLGGANSLMMAVPVGDDLPVQAEGYGIPDMTDIATEVVLGTIEEMHPWADGWSETPVTYVPRSGGGEGGAWLELEYIIGPPDAGELPAPFNLVVVEVPMFPDPDHRIMWEWEGDVDIDGFRIYRNGNLWVTVADPDTRSRSIPLVYYEPPCGELYEYTVMAYRGDVASGLESLPSNPFAVEGEPCDLEATVTFLSVDTGCLPMVSECGVFGSGTSPAFGEFWANAETMDWGGAFFGDGGDWLAHPFIPSNSSSDFDVDGQNGTTHHNRPQVTAGLAPTDDLIVGWRLEADLIGSRETWSEGTYDVFAVNGDVLRAQLIAGDTLGPYSVGAGAGTVDFVINGTEIPDAPSPAEPVMEGDDIWNFDFLGVPEGSDVSITPVRVDYRYASDVIYGEDVRMRARAIGPDGVVESVTCVPLPIEPGEHTIILEMNYVGAAEVATQQILVEMIQGMDGPPFYGETADYELNWVPSAASYMWNPSFSEPEGSTINELEVTVNYHHDAAPGDMVTITASAWEEGAMDPSVVVQPEATVVVGVGDPDGTAGPMVISFPDPGLVETDFIVLQLEINGVPGADLIVPYHLTWGNP